MVFQFDTNGALIQPAKIWSNEELQPQLSSTLLGTYYLVTFMDQNGATLNKSPLWWQFPESSGATVDISQMIAISTIGGNIIYYPTILGGGGGGGSVTSVAFVGDGTIFSATPSTPVTTAGDIAATLLTQSANTVLAGPVSGIAAFPTFRALVAADISGVIGGTIAATQVAFGSGANTIQGSANLTYVSGGPLNINSNNTGPVNVTGAVLALTNTLGTSTAYIIKDAGNSLILRNDSTLIESLGKITFNGANGTINITAGSNGPGINLQTTAVAPMGVGSVKIDTNQTGSGIHGLQITNNLSSGIVLDTDISAIHFFGITSGVASIGVAAIAGTPNEILLPTTTGTAGQVLITDGGNPQQASWASGTTTVAAGTVALGTAAIPSGTAATLITISAPGVLTTDNIMADFNSDPTGVVGYQPSASGMLTIIKFPSVGFVNFYVVNNTGLSITPGAITLNYRVVR